MKNEYTEAYIKAYMATHERMFGDIYPVFVGEEKCAASHFAAPKIREYHLLHICVEGKGIFCKNGAVYKIAKGMGFWIYPQEESHYQADDKQPWSYVWIALCGEKVESYLKLMGVSKENPICQCTDPALHVSCIEEILCHNTLKIADQFYIQSLLMKLLSDLIQGQGKDVCYSVENKKNLYINRAISYVELHYKEDVTVQELADYLAINRSYMSELFSRTIGMSPKEYLIKYRIAKARNMLVYTDRSVEDIAVFCGYSNLSSFSKVFKKDTGYSPIQYRREKGIYRAKGEKKSQHLDKFP